MSKFKYLIITLTLIFASSSSLAGTPKRISAKIPATPNTQADISAYKLKLIAAEKNSLTLSEYRIQEKIIVSDFKKIRKNKILQMRAKEVIQCYVRANRPSPTKGRKRDKCSISNDSSYFRGWNVISANDKRLDTFNGGKPRGSSKTSNNRVTLSLSCVSPKWRDTTSGRCQLTMQTTITYKPSEQYIIDSINKEIGILLSN